MNLCNCINCKKTIKYVSGPKLCKECDEKLFKIIKEYLDIHKSADARNISMDTKIPYKIIKAYIDDSRFYEIRKDLNKCKMCGDSISDDLIYCKDCLKKIKAINALGGFNDSTNDKTETAGMRFIGKR